MENLSAESSQPFLANPDVNKERHSDDSDPYFSNNELRKHSWRWLFPAAITVLLATNGVTFFFAKWKWQRNLDGICALHTSENWSPILRDVDISYSTTMFNGTFYKDTIYRQDPSPAVDAAWEALGINYKGVVVSFEEARKAGISSDRLRVDEQYGGPGHPAVVEVMHQLHCLNLIRQTSYYNFDYYANLKQGSFKDPEKILKPHIGHCLEYVRQSLICTADTGLHPFLWAKTDDNPPHVFPDFSRNHKCKNFDAVRAWAEDHQSPIDRMDIVPKKGELILPEIP